jgi:hypothetical protein
MSAKRNRLVLELIDADKGEMFFSKPILYWHHLSRVKDKDLGGLVRSYLLDNIDGEIILKNAESTKHFLRVFKEEKGDGASTS